MTVDLPGTDISRAVEVAPRLPDPAMPDADWADTFELTSQQSFGDIRELARETVGSMPPWARALLTIRNLIVRPLGLKPDGMNDAVNAAEMIDIFPIISQTSERIVLGLDDSHLDFRIVLERNHHLSGNRVRLTTLVRRHNLFGRLYIAAITPFHKAIVRASLSQTGVAKIQGT